MGERAAVAKAADIRPGALAAFDIGGRRVAICNEGGRYYAFDDTCTHEECSLSDGSLNGTSIMCMCHGAEFDVTSGAVLAPPADIPLRVYPVHVEGGTLFVDIG